MNTNGHADVAEQIKRLQAAIETLKRKNQILRADIVRLKQRIHAAEVKRKTEPAD